jgi:hypothetical protein
VKRRRRTFIAAVPALVLLAGCYETPAQLGGGGIITITGTEQGVADGQSLLDFAVVVDAATAPDQAITVQTSSGVLAQGADPTTADARTLTLKNVGTGQIPFTLRVGNLPGETVVTAAVDGFVATKKIALTASPIDSIALGTDRRSITADGQSAANITVQLFAATPPHLVSVGARVALGVCCPDTTATGGGLKSCPDADPPPLLVPSEAQLTTGQSLEVRAVSERIDAGVGVPASIPVTFTVTALTAAAPAPDPCAAAAAGVVRATLPLSLVPVAATP